MSHKETALLSPRCVEGVRRKPRQSIEHRNIDVASGARKLRRLLLQVETIAERGSLKNTFIHL
jgi:hypothetical protein